uniref:lycopene cyclase family protein n=1 Tax=Flavobacterium sp. TaxID=239 RepID=UPI00404B17CB
MQTFDYIIIGSGLSGLLTAHEMSKDNWFANKTILILDQHIKNTNDRTWCFWEKETGEFESIVHKNWQQAFIGNQDKNKIYDLNPYQYKMIKSADFYDFIKNKLLKNPNIHFVQDKVLEVIKNKNANQIIVQNKTYEATFVLDSIFDAKPVENQKQFPYLKQHFIGWFVKTDENMFDPEVVTFMDFTIPQKGNTRFMYVLPTSQQEALFEYTLFSEDLLDKNEYELAIQDYLHVKGISNYKIIEKEKGNIPMTSFSFSDKNSARYLKIGTAGGWTKASTGFTFNNSLKFSKQLVGFLKTNQALNLFTIKNRYSWYDLILLEVLHRNNEKGSEIFSQLFHKNSVKSIFQFLNEEGSVLEDFKLMNSMQKWIFIKAVFRTLQKKYFLKH